MADDEITIRWSGGERVFGPGLVRLGRDPSNDVVIDNPNVSRHHGELRHGASGWTYTDTGSAQGSFTGDAPVTTTAVSGTTTIQLGRSAGERLELTVRSEERTLTRSGAGGPGGAAAPDVTVLGDTDRQRPGGALRHDQIQGATVVTGDVINVECAGRSYSFSPGQVVRIGRDPDGEVVSANPTVSRHHADLRYEDGSWVLEDKGSSGGTFHDGRRVTTLKLAGSTAVLLGSLDAGERVVLVASGSRTTTGSERIVRAARRRTPVLIVGAVAVVAALIAVAALVKQGGGSSSPSNDRLAKAVVRIDLDGEPAGSGTVVDAARGLILTNAHVAAPQAAGQGVRYHDIESSLRPDPREIVIAVSGGLDEVAEPTFIAKVVASDGYLDLAVLQVTGTVGGAVVEEGSVQGLTDVELGDSDALRTGSAVRVFGFPAISASNATTLTEGVVSGPVEDQRLRTNRAFLNLDAPIRGGNSGGLAADGEGRLVGVPTLSRIRGDETPVASMRPIDLARPLIDAARAGEPYTSEVVQPLTGEEDLDGFAIVSPARPGFEPNCTTARASADPGAKVLALAFTYVGFAAGQPQDLRVDVVRDTTRIGTVTTDEQWPFTWNETGCVTATVPLTQALAAGTYRAYVYAGPNYHLLSRVEIEVG